MVRRLLALAALLAATSAGAQPFYTDRLQRGIANYQRGAYELAAKDLRLAAFGLLDSPPDYETALVYEVLANQKLERRDDAALAAEKVAHVERVAPAYARLTLPGDVRAAFESALPSLLTAEQLARAPALAHLASRSTTPAPRTPPPQKPIVAAPSAANLALEAYAKLQSGDDAGARELATKVTADDYTNALAHTVLAILAGRRGDAAGVVEHYAIVRTRRRLSDAENVAFHDALLRAGRKADAAGVERLLSDAARRPPSGPGAIPARQIQPFVAMGSDTPAGIVAEADRLLAAQKITAARDAYLRAGRTGNLTRELALAVARGLYQTAAYRASSAEYQKLYPLRNGEELHMFYEAVNRYEIGDYSIARLLLSRALPALPRTPQVDLYRKRIETAR